MCNPGGIYRFTMATSLWSQKSCVCNLPSVPRKACWAKSGSCIRKHIRCKQISSRSGKALVLQCGVEPQEVVNVPRADDVLPDNLPDAIRMAGEATANALAAGGIRCMVEILLPEFWDPTSGPLFKEEGDQQRFWKLTRRFVDTLIIATGYSKVRVIYPDMGVAAMLGNQWEDKKFSIGSLNDRVMTETTDELIIVAAPDPPGLEACQRLVGSLNETQAVVLFNPRLTSGDVGVGLNTRRLRKTFLNTFTVTYSLYPIGDIGSVFRRYPGIWQVFIEDPGTPGRYRLAAEKDERPAADSLDYIISMAMQGDRDDGSEPDGNLGVLDQVASTVASFQRFLKSMSS